MSKFDRRVNMTAVLLPPVVIVVAIVLGWGSYVGAIDLAIFAVMYVLTGFGITLGFHRLLTHRSFATSKPLEHGFAALGSMAVQGPVISWVADHRKHHAHTDEEGDPHSPHAGHDGGLKGMVQGLFHAHVGWLWQSHGRAEYQRYARDLYDDPTMRSINRAFPYWVGLTLLVPAVLGFLLSGLRWQGALTALLWAGLVRVFLLQHVTWSINSVCHFFGRRRFDVEDHSTNVFWLALPSLGEAWHHNHHAFPRSAKHGLRWYELDPSAAVITSMEKLGLVWDVTRISPERQAQKTLAPEQSVAA